ncbi:DNA methyltransferase [Ottowia sp.]|uniref:class I SAM-dependent DNA methyltransferase n=1 Tax=Ottowia sp. TaxID=1898956 RepID=UPI0025F89954|nr:DNA methyltransferase [Ottowia sp.]MBK6745438.1 class I SAM-dependent DNA methyltransferase [Ottowia sp.]
MNAVEIEQALSDLAEQPSSTFDAAEFPFAFLAAFGNKETTIKRLRAGNNNTSDVPGGVLQRGNIHVATCGHGTVGETLTALRNSAATAKAKAKYILATDGHTAEAEYLPTFETIACDYPKLPEHLGFFLALAGISTIQEIKDNPIDVRATGRLNKLYVELLRDNPGWAGDARRADMNHFMARLIFCFFAEDTDIFNGEGLFTRTISQFTEASSANTHEVMGEIFRAMNTQPAERAAGNFRPWADQFPYVNGGLFSGNTEVPRFSRIARTYLLHAGSLQWRQINPDIFGSMIQAVADEEERGALGMHYTSVPNILKVLNPLFLDELRAQLNEAGDNKTKLLNLRKRMARIRVFDPACGSGNFLVIAYKQMRAIEAEINRRRGESDLGSEIPLTNFRGIELRSFPAEIARLALIIAEYQCDVQYRGQKEALAEFLPLDAQNWIVCGNALRLDWLGICPPTGTGVKVAADDLFETPLDQKEMDFENNGGETFICGNPPYLGSRGQSEAQKADLAASATQSVAGYRGLDFVAGWLIKATLYSKLVESQWAFVTTNSICQGEQVSLLWQWLFDQGLRIKFARTSFRWSNLAANNAGVTVIVVGLTTDSNAGARLYTTDSAGNEVVRDAFNINPYLVPGKNVFVAPRSEALGKGTSIDRGSAPTDEGAYLFSSLVRNEAIREHPHVAPAVVRAYGAKEFAAGLVRWALKPDLLPQEVRMSCKFVSDRVDLVRKSRTLSPKAATRRAADTPEKFTEDRYVSTPLIFIPQLVAEGREYVTPGLLPANSLVLAPHFQATAESLVPLSLIASRLHLVWIATVCGKLETRYRYSNTLGWNTFPVPLLTEQMKADLTECAQNILLAREAHFPATIADLYDPEAMPDNLRAAHERNDEVLERIYIGRRFKNDTERLEKLFDLYTKMTAEQKAKPKARAKGGKP